MTPERKKEIDESEYSRGRFGVCKNKGCYNERRRNSAYCYECSDKLKNNK